MGRPEQRIEEAPRWGEVVRELTEAELAWKVATLRECAPLAAPEPGQARLDFGASVEPLVDTRRG